MIKILNKKESAYHISKLKLNRFPQIICSTYNPKTINEFVSKYPAQFYAVRDMSKSNSKVFNLKVKKEDLHEYTKNLNGFLINVSSINYTDNQLCTGEVKIEHDMSISLTVSNNQNFSARDAVNFPNYNFTTDIYDAKLKQIRGLDKIINYIFKYQLFGIIVEFSAFNITLGTNNEDVAIYELRTNY